VRAVLQRAVPIALLALGACPAPPAPPARPPPPPATKAAPPPRPPPRTAKAPPSAGTAPPAVPAPATEPADLQPIRELVAAHADAVQSKRWPRTEAQVCVPGARNPLGLERAVYLDERGRIRRYVVVRATDDVTYRLEHDYDAQGRLRSCLATAAAATGAEVTERLFFSAAGALVAREPIAASGRYGFARGWPENGVVRDPDADFVAPAPPECGR